MRKNHYSIAVASLAGLVALQWGTGVGWAQTGEPILRECGIDADQLPPYTVVDGIFGARADGPTVIAPVAWPPASSATAPPGVMLPEDHFVLSELDIGASEGHAGGWLAVLIEGSAFPETPDALTEPLTIRLFWAPNGEPGSVRRDLGLLAPRADSRQPDPLDQVGLRLEGNQLLEVCYPGPELGDPQRALCDAYLSPIVALETMPEPDYRDSITWEQAWPRDEYSTARDLAGDGEYSVLRVTERIPPHPALGDRINIPAATPIDRSSLAAHPYWRQAIHRLTDEEPDPQYHLERLVEVAAWLDPIQYTDDYNSLDCIQQALSVALADALARSPSAPEDLTTLRGVADDQITEDVLYRLNAEVQPRDWALANDDHRLHGGFVNWIDDETLLVHRSANNEFGGTWLCTRESCEPTSLDEYPNVPSADVDGWIPDYYIYGADPLDVLTDDMLSYAGVSQDRRRRYLVEWRERGQNLYYTLWLRAEPGPTWYRLAGISISEYMVDQTGFLLVASPSARYVAVVWGGSLHGIYEVRALSVAQPPTLPADHYDSLDQACDAVAQIHDEAIAWADFYGEGDGPFGQCVVWGDSAWAIQLGDMEDGPYGLDGEWWPVFVSAETGIVADPDVDRDSGFNYRELDDQITYLSVEVFDFDGDGVAEGIFRNHHWRWEDDPTPDISVYTHAEHGVAPYGPAWSFSIVSVSDVDDDERPDLVLDTPFYAYDCALGYPIRGPSFLAHSLPSGFFSTDDDVALEYLRNQCPVPLSGNVSGSDEDVLQRSACARIWGVDSATLTDHLSDTYDGDCLPLADVLEWVQADPIVTLAEMSGMRVTVSNFIGGTYDGYDFAPINLIDGEMSSTWQVQNGVGAWFRIDLDEPTEITGLEIANGYQHVDEEHGDLFGLNARIATAVLTFSDGSTTELVFGPEEQGWVSVEIEPREISWVEVRVTSVHAGLQWDDLAVSEIRFIRRD